ncbi:hypothetical protein Kpol_1004p37 [Vanderwaltozyma polyspora DSM 70294]|uniref:Phosphatidylinositol N-acetylglucosaminyltransferase subunit GPI19 n=1 Tax=Vanderwaltozyma polyspora (strain ATCC 22028 / DSM 70294 / BCRC 21397 / CBS 2163 / NBRC 10782 / NRRL Y-8283 / UCD 57-17) TaxID=436907 RepID=A7TJ93_VANPO|nr:uncharacterized protein Kpol_1004p37 [Vanderwaltozyma polyspora DSM 70294]EDO17662.1 hypothetical protein Kpol_1004p37 [Vanderwaltozyma polyspora DSM 70294]
MNKEGDEILYESGWSTDLMNMNVSYTNEYFWFSRHFLTCSLLVFLIVWSLIPQDVDIWIIRKEFINDIMDILPQRSWLIYFECFVLMGMLWVYTALLMYNEDVLTPALDELRTITDAKGNVATEDDFNDFLDKHAFKESSGVIDLPITEVCEILYREQRTRSSKG